MTLEEALTRVRHTSYGSQPDCGLANRSRPSTISVNSSLAAGDIPWAAASPSAAFRFIFLRSCLLFLRSWHVGDPPCSAALPWCDLRDKSYVVLELKANDRVSDI